MAEPGLWAGLDQPVREQPGLWDALMNAQFSPGTAWGNKAADIGTNLAYGAMKGLVTLPQRAIENSQNSLNTGTYDPGPTLEAATLPMGTGAIAGVPVRGAEAVVGAGPIRAYHGSPHDFDRFDLSKIGTGEGNQAYGHGLYFAENEGVAKSYRDALKDNAPLIGGKAADPSNPEHLAAAFLSQYKTPQAAIKELDDSIAWSAANPQFAPPKEHIAAAQQAKDIIASGKPLPSSEPNPGRMYEVNINADPAHFLDWDRPIGGAILDRVGDASRGIRPNLYERAMGTGRDLAKWGLAPENIAGKTGESVVGALKRGLGSDMAAAAALREAGVPGIKYLDQGSRAAGDGSRNYVVFNDKLIDILKKYGIAGVTTPLATGLGLTGQDNSQ
jgi:hypothetical protein